MHIFEMYNPAERPETNSLSSVTPEPQSARFRAPSKRDLPFYEIAIRHGWYKPKVSMDLTDATHAKFMFTTWLYYLILTLSFPLT